MPKLFGYIPVPNPPRFGYNITKSKWFESAVTKSFVDTDLDQDKKLDHKELYIALLRLYDLLNSKLPCHIKVPKVEDIDALMAKFDVNASGKLELEEYLKLCRALVASRKNWRDSIFLKIIFVVALKTAAFPFLGGALKAGAEAAGLTTAKKVPNGVLAFTVEQLAKQALPLPL